MSPSKSRVWTVASILAPVLVYSAPAHASEGGASFYLLGGGGPEAAMLPPVRGIFFDNTAFYYHGKAKGDGQFVVGGNVVAGLRASLVASMLYRKTGNLRACQLLLGHTKLESTVRYLGVELDDALELSEGLGI